MDQMLWYLLAATRGGSNRLRLIGLLKERPYNAHQLAELLSLDYRTVRHHLGLMLRNGLLVNPGVERYGSLYFLSATALNRWPVVEEIRARTGPVAGSTDITSGTRAHNRNLTRRLVDAP